MKINHRKHEPTGTKMTQQRLIRELKNWIPAHAGMSKSGKG